MEDIKKKEFAAPSGSENAKLQNTVARETPDHVNADNKTSEYKPAAKAPGQLGAYQKG